MKARLTITLLLAVTLATCGSGTTTVGNPSNDGTGFTINPSHIVLSGVSGSSLTITAESGAVTLPDDQTSSDLSLLVTVNGTPTASLNGSDFEAALTKGSLQTGSKHLAATMGQFSLTITASIGQTVIMVFSLGPTTSPIILIAIAASEAVNPTETDAATLSADNSTVISDGTDALASLDITTAESTFCDQYEAGSTNSQVAFGCFLAKLILLPETTEANAIMASLDEAEIDVEALILEGIFGTPVQDTGADDFIYTDYPDLPFNDIFDSASTLASKLAQLVERLNATSTSSSTFRGQIQDIIPLYQYLEALLTIVLNDSDFEFTIPSELFTTDNDLTASYNDVRLFMAETKAALVGLNIFAAYDVGVEPDSVIDGSGDYFDYEALADDLNGADSSTPFLTLEDATLITDNKQRCEDAIDYALTGLNALDGGEASDLFDESLDQANLTIGIDFLEDLQDSIGAAALVPIRGIDTHDLTIGLYNFFDNPPSAADVTGSDPFIYNADENKIEMVEAYFSELLDSYADW